MSNEEAEFSIPDQFLEKLYEFSGGAEHYKGLILAVCSESGDPLIFSKFDSPVVEVGLRKVLVDYLEGRFDPES